MRFGRIIKETKQRINKERNKIVIEMNKKGVSEEELAKKFNIRECDVHVIIRDFMKKERENLNYKESVPKSLF